MRACFSRSLLIVPCLILTAGLNQAAAKTLCVNPRGAHGCYSSIQSAVNAAANNDVIKVGPGIYPEEVTIGKPLSLLGASPAQSIIQAGNFAHGIFVDGYDYPGLANVTISGFTVRGALFEGILVVSVSNAKIQNNNVADNDSTSGLSFTGALTGCPNQPGNGIWETDETGDCGGAIHMVGTVNSIVSGNTMTGNADGVLLSDETAEAQGNLITHNIILNNPLECGIVLASHPPAGQTMTVPLPPHNGVNNNVVSENISANNGVLGRGRWSRHVLRRRRPRHGFRQCDQRKPAHGQRHSRSRAPLARRPGIWRARRYLLRQHGSWQLHFRKWSRYL